VEKGARITTAHACCGPWVIVALLAILAQGCALTGGVAGLEDDGSFAVPYAYKGFGAGPQPVFGVVELNEGAEASTISWALLEAMQRLQLSVIEPPTQLDKLLPPGKPWKTDIALLDPKNIQEHNRRFPHMALPGDRVYGIQYEGEYIVLKKELRFQLKSILYHRGMASDDYRLYPRKDYSGSFFKERAEALIKEHLGAASRRGVSS
jgi:hypothetical protein